MGNDRIVVTWPVFYYWPIFAMTRAIRFVWNRMSATADCYPAN